MTATSAILEISRNRGVKFQEKSKFTLFSKAFNGLQVLKADKQVEQSASTPLASRLRQTFFFRESTEKIRGKAKYYHVQGIKGL